QRAETTFDKNECASCLGAVTKKMARRAEVERVLPSVERDRRAAPLCTQGEEEADMTHQSCTRKLVKADWAAPTRRSFLSRAAGLSTLAVPVVTLMTSGKARAQGSGRLTGLNAELINEILADEAQHVPIIQNLLNDPDN